MAVQITDGLRQTDLISVPPEAVTMQLISGSATVPVATVGVSPTASATGLDSAHYGLLPEENIKGKVVYILRSQ